MSVERALVTADGEDQLQLFHLATCVYANAIERRENTVFYTVMGEDWSKFVDAGRQANITIQQMDSSNRDEEVWNVVNQGTADAWKTKTGKPAKVQKITVIVKRR